MKIFYLITFLILSSCASYQVGDEASITSSDSKEKANVLVTISKNDELSTEYFTFYQIDFGNKSDDWIEVEKVLINYNGDELKFVLGNKLVEWTKSIQNKVKVDRYNMSMVMGSVLALSTAAVASDNMTSDTYAVFATGTLVSASVNDISNELSDIERTKLFPDNHLYQPFRIPPGLVSKRWLLVQHKKGIQLSNLAFDVFYKEKGKITYSLKL